MGLCDETFLVLYPFSPFSLSRKNLQDVIHSNDFGSKLGQVTPSHKVFADYIVKIGRVQISILP